ncbi:Beta-mannosidase, partial [Acropora cervicornis]
MAVWRNFEQMKYILVFLCCCRHIDRISSTEINLGGPWKVQNANKSLSVYGEVPGNVHTALFRNGRIPNPYFRFNDVHYRWIAYDNWTYARTLEVSEALHSKRQVVLVFEGLDTVATVLVNGIKVGQSANMFHRYIFDAKGALKTGLNMIEVRFISAILYAKEQAKKYPYPVPPECPVPVQRGERNVYLQAYNSAVIRDITVTPTKVTSENITWELSVEAFVHAANDWVPGSLSISLPELSRSLKFALKLSKGMQRVSFPVMTFSKKDGVKEWWPQGYGKQNLYALKVMFTSSSGEEMSSISRKIGFRKVRLVQEQIKQSTDAFEDRVTSSVLRNLLQSAADANMNEFMFACALYPTNEDFLASVREEVQYQVRRLHYHPSVFVWSANNENEAALADNWLNTLEKEDKSRQFLPSSPSNGVDTEREGWIASKPNSVFWGDVHFYDYKMDCWNLTGYPKPRFASEYGFQSYPSFETLAKVSLPEDWSYNSAFMNHRQHHGNGRYATHSLELYHIAMASFSTFSPRFQTCHQAIIQDRFIFASTGNKQMLYQASKHFNLPNSTDSLKKYKDTLYLTQVTQAQCMKVETEHYRRLQSHLVKAPTWSSLEYGGRWKMLHYFAKDFYAPVIASPFVNGTKFQIFVISDLTKPIVKGAVSLKAWAWSSFKPLSSKSITFNINQTTSKLVYSEDLETLIKNSGCESLRHCVLTVTPADLSTGENLGPSNVLKVTQKSKVEFTVSIGAQSPAVFVWLVSKDFNGRFSENGFLLTESFKT